MLVALLLSWGSFTTSALQAESHGVAARADWSHWWEAGPSAVLGLGANSVEHRTMGVARGLAIEKAFEMWLNASSMQGLKNISKLHRNRSMAWKEAGERNLLEDGFDVVLPACVREEAGSRVVHFQSLAAECRAGHWWEQFRENLCKPSIGHC